MAVGDIGFGDVKYWRERCLEVAGKLAELEERVFFSGGVGPTGVEGEHGHPGLPGPPGLDECDPTGRDPHAPGAKLDAGKPRMGLVLGDFALALTEVAKVGTMGAAKYTDHGWLEVPDGVSRYKDALLRHLLTREDIDSQSGLLHDAHAAWNALAVLELRLRTMREDE